jgi:hypothetical protein
MICRKMETEFKSLMPDLLLDRERVPAAVRAHVEQCADCSKELKSLEATILALDAWEGVEPSPFFEARMAARMREAREAQPAGFLERARAWLLFGSNLHMRPLAAGALVTLVLIGGGTYAGFVGLHPASPVVASATVKDLQSLDENAQVFQQMNALDQPDNDSGSTDSGSQNSN